MIYRFGASAWNEEWLCEARESDCCRGDELRIRRATLDQGSRPVNRRTDASGRSRTALSSAARHRARARLGGRHCSIRLRARSNRTCDHTALVSRVPDDAFYYLEIAARLARGQGFTFDGIHETNGFHPLWQLLLTPFAAFLHGDALIRGALVVGLLCSFAAVLLVMRVVWRLGGAGPALFGAIVASQFVLRSWVNGMEGP